MILPYVPVILVFDGIAAYFDVGLFRRRLGVIESEFIFVGRKLAHLDGLPDAIQCERQKINAHRRRRPIQLGAFPWAKLSVCRQRSHSVVNQAHHRVVVAVVPPTARERRQLIHAFKNLVKHCRASLSLAVEKDLMADIA
jgi:hypothetical protein